MLSTAIESSSRSDPGRVRELNEDNLAVLPEFGLVVLADGMGGYNAGEVASQQAVEAVSAGAMSQLVAGSEPDFETLVQQANDALFQRVDEEPELKGMATTLVLGWFQPGVLRYAHVGDSRLYRMRGGVLEALTRDHSMVQALVDQGLFASIPEALEAGVRGNILTRGLGIDPQLEVEQGVTATEPGDLYLFCSDGLYNMVDEPAMTELMQQSGGDLEALADSLLARALECGGKDNISLVLAREAGKAEPDA